MEEAERLGDRVAIIEHGRVFEVGTPHELVRRHCPARRVVYTTNAIESLHSRLRKIIKTRGHFPSDDAATKLIWLALRNITADWSRSAKEWREAMNQFAVLYDERFTRHAHGGL
jgi:transposase-like protein